MLKVGIVKKITRVELMISFLFKYFCNEGCYLEERRGEKESNIIHTIARRNGKWVGHVLRRNCLLKHVTEGKIERRIEVTGRRIRRRK